MKGDGIIRTCIYKCCEYGTAKEEMNVEMSLSIGIPRYKGKRQIVERIVLGDVCRFVVCIYFVHLSSGEKRTSELERPI